MADSRIASITVRNLLNHSGGWDASISGEPVVPPIVTQIAAKMGVPFPPPPEAIVSYMLDQRLDFSPGSRFAYSNFGFIVLGRIIEKISGQRYEDFVRQQILAPMGIERMRQSRTSLPLRAPDEVHYYDYAGAPLVDSLIAGVSGSVAEPYSGILPLESIDSAGAWMASAIDLVRIFVMLDGQRPPAVVSSASVEQMVTPAFTLNFDPEGNPVSYGLGIGMISSGPDAMWWHNGGTWGTRAIAARMRNGWAWAVIFNSTPWESLYTATGGGQLDIALQSLFSVDALESVSWPKIDLFPHYLSSNRVPVSAQQ